VNDLHAAINRELADPQRHAEDIRSALETADAPLLSLAQTLVEVNAVSEHLACIVQRLEPFTDVEESGR
jgi:hypothetical protein